TTGALCDEGVVVMENLKAPQPARAGENVQLHCLWSVRYSGGNNGLLHKRGKGFSQVKWWKDGHQLFKIDSNKEKTDYRLPGVDIITKKSDSKMVTLRAVSRSSEGQYVCEVMGEGPTFRTTNATVNLTVAEVPQAAEVTGVRPVYRTGE
ncbi:Immunoglobulin-like domain, partial [Trinorchestia longiramus]